MAQPSYSRPLRPAAAEILSPTPPFSVDTKEYRLAHQAYGILRGAYTVVPLAAGIDKFFNFTVEWPTYLAPLFPRMLGITDQTFMYFVGIVEIIAGVGVAIKPKVFSPIVALWLGAIIANLIINGTDYDIALRDFGLCLGALALFRLSTLFDQRV